VHRVARSLHLGERPGKRRPRRFAALDTADAVERVEKRAVAGDERRERIDGRRGGAGKALAGRAHEGVRPFERIGELRHGLGGQAAAHDEVGSLVCHGDEQVGVGRCEAPVGAPEAAGGEHERQRCLDPRPGGAYHPATRSRMAVSRLPSIYFEKLVESSPDIVVAVDRQGIISFYNDGAQETLGYTPEEVLGQHVTRLYPDLAEARKVMAAMRQGRNCETTFVMKSGARIPVVIAGSIIRDDAGGELGSIGFAKDLREIRRRDQLATLGEVAIGLAHEINNPLEVIVNNLNLLEAHIAKVSSDDDFVVESERLDSIHTALRRIQGIVAQLTKMAHGANYTTRDYLPGTPMTDLRANHVPGDGARPAAAVDQQDPALRGLRILVVDDDLGVCQSLRDLLTQEGCEVLVATGGREAVGRLENVRVDLVLSDVVMPDLDGYELFQEIRRRHPGLPVVLMTAFHFDKDHVIKRSRLAGLDDVVYKKPIDPPRLREIIKRHARRHPEAAAG
jgi:PAS domain S-box-containing protein